MSHDVRDGVGLAYLERLSGADLRALVDAERAGTAAEAEAWVAALRREPALVLDVLDRPATSARLLNLAADPRGERLSMISPLLVFATAVHRTAADLAGASYAPERAAPRVRVPVFDAARLVDYLADPWHRLFLADLLASFARTSSGVIVTHGSDGTRRRRWDDLDLSRLTDLLEAARPAQRASVWRRMGDLALFLAGVFPDAAGRAAPSAAEAPRLAHRTGLPSPPQSLGPTELLEWFGAGWYRLAADRTAATATTGPGGYFDAAAHMHEARRVLNTAADRYLFPLATEWFPAPG